MAAEPVSGFRASRRRAGREATAEYLTVRVYYGAGLEVCVLVGEVDLLTAPLLRRVLCDMEMRGVPKVVLDLSEVGFLSVAGARLLATAAERARAAHRRFGLVVATRPVRIVLGLTGLADGIACYACLPEAVRALSPPDGEPDRGR